MTDLIEYQESLEPLHAHRTENVLVVSWAASKTLQLFGHMVRRSGVRCSIWHKGPPPDWMDRYAVLSMKIKCLPNKLYFLVIVSDLAGCYKICIKTAHLMLQNIQKS